MASKSNPSLYPTADTPTATRPSAPPASAQPASESHSETLPPDYELLLHIRATVTELSASPFADTTSHSVSSDSSATLLSTPKEADLRVIQGPLPPSTPVDASAATAAAQQTFFHAFIAFADLNLPLLPTCVGAHPMRDAFTLAIPNRAFVIRPHKDTEPDLVDALDRLLRWFCRWDNATYTDDAAAAAAAVAAAKDAATVAAGSADVSAASSQPQQPQPLAPEGIAPDGVAADGVAQSATEGSPGTSTADRIAKAGDYGVQLVEKVGDALHRKLTSELGARRERAAAERAAADASGETSRDVRVGGRVTTGLLGATRRVVGVGASAAAAVSERVSSAIGNRMASNAVSRNMANAPEDSLKRGLYDNLMAGMVALGRVYVAADAKGRLIIEDVGNEGTEITRAKYGDDAASATRSIAGIALDGYRISRFPAKLGATAIVRGAVKSQFSKAGTGADVSNAQSSSYGYEPPARTQNELL